MPNWDELSKQLENVLNNISDIEFREWYNKRKNKIMTPKEKARELIEKFTQLDFMQDEWGIYTENAKQCALICCDEIQNTYTCCDKDNVNFWFEVENEIKKL